ncbi:MAG: 3-methyl-2-oxobutanoate hydroxymethyltransferase [Peptococcaceae bacterium]|nr:3-methyl-2-oxobutanoate hydroxymethyltransferase [Peptococcaceae bacterium]
MKKTIQELQKMAKEGNKITMLTAYDYPTAYLLEKADIDTILVGDSLGMVVLGYDSTVPVTMDEMVHHTKAVRRGAPDTFVIADLPYLSYSTPQEALFNSGRLIKEGRADAVKLEGGQYFAPIIEYLTKNGIPVVAHIGLTPQTSTQLGGFKVQGKDLESASKIYHDALAVEKAGAIMVVLEAIPAPLAARITAELIIPTIGIGAGEKCDGQVLVVHDLLGLYEKFVPKFVKQYENLAQNIQSAVKQYCQEVKDSEFPTPQHSFQMEEAVLNSIFTKD